MAHIDTFSMKCELAIAMREVVEARQHYLAAQQLFQGLGIDEGRSFISGLVTHFEKTLSHYFKAQCETLTQSHANGTPAQVELDSSFYSFERQHSSLYRDPVQKENNDARSIKPEAMEKLRAVDNSGVSASEQIRVMCDALDCLNWEGIERSLNEQVANLAPEGMRQVSEKLAQHLSMSSRWYEPKFKSGRYIFTTYSTSWSQNFEKARELNSLLDALNKVSSETGFNFGSAVEQLITEVQNLGYHNEIIPSRTVMAKGSPIEVRCFNEKYEYRFTREAFEAIQAFISLYGDDSAIDAVMSAAQLDQQQAA